MLASQLPRDEFDVHVAVLTRTGPLESVLRAAEIPVELIGKRRKLDPGAWWRTRKLIRRLKPQIVHTWIFAANCYGRHAAFCERVPFVIAGERCVDSWKRSYEFWIDRKLARRTSHIATNSNGVVEFYGKHGIAREKFVVIPNGIDPACVQGGIGRDALCSDLGIASDVKLIGAVGRLWPQKRYKDLIWAAELLRAGRAGESHLVIAGDGPERDRMHEYAAQVGVAKFVHFLGARADAAKLIPAFDCFWLGSGYEGQSNALMEAMCSGTPAVVSDIAGNRDLITHDETGWLVKVGDAAGYARKANTIFEEPQLAQRVAAAARTRMTTDFTIEKMVEGYADMYRELVS